MTVTAAVPLVFPDVESVVAGFLRGRAEMSGIPVGSVLPAGFDGTQRAVVATRLGGFYADDDQLDHAEVRLDSYGPDKPAAQAVSLAVRGVLPIIPFVALGGGVVLCDVSEIQGPCFSIDRKHFDANRYIVRYRFVAEVKPRPA